jgi:hypothetical protein
VIGDLLPRQCGIAAFTTDLCAAIPAKYGTARMLALPQPLRRHERWLSSLTPSASGLTGFHLCLLSSQRYTVEPTLSVRSICFVAYRNSQLRRFHAEGHSSASNDAEHFKEMRVKMKPNIRTRDFVFRL